MNTNTNISANSVTNIIVPDFPRKLVYFEKQSNDKLCGLHCINSLLQYPNFDPISLAEIAHSLDELERKLYEEDSEFTNINSNFKLVGNVDDDGNYNIQVLSEALKLLNTEIIPLKQNECEKLLNESMDTVEAFIFNSSTHWFAIRKICNIWFNLNSTNPYPGPQIISDFYLSAFIKGTEELGYTNFLVKNLPPLIDLDSIFYKNLLPFQRLVPIEEIVKNKPKKINMGDTDEQALEKAIELSKNEYDKSMGKFEGINYGNNFYDFKPNNDYTNLNVVNQSTNFYEGFYINEYDQYLIELNEMKSAIEMSLNEYIDNIKINLPKEPEEGSENLNLSFKRIDKTEPTIFYRKFNLSDKIGDVKNYVKVIFRTYGNIKLTGLKNNKIYLNDQQSLIEAGISNNDTLGVNIIE